MHAHALFPAGSLLSTWTSSGTRRLALAAAASLAGAGALAQGASPPASAASAPPAGVLVDANGTPMGPYYPLAWGTTPGPGALLSLNGQPVILPLRASSQPGSPSGALPTGNRNGVFFEHRDCTGAAWIQEIDFPAGLAHATILPDGPKGAIAYVAGASEPKQVTVRSVKFDDGRHSRPGCRQEEHTFTGRRVDQVVDLSTLYAVPYHVQ